MVLEGALGLYKQLCGTPGLWGIPGGSVVPEPLVLKVDLQRVALKGLWHAKGLPHTMWLKVALLSLQKALWHSHGSGVVPRPLGGT